MIWCSVKRAGLLVHWNDSEQSADIRKQLAFEGLDGASGVRCKSLTPPPLSPWPKKPLSLRHCHCDGILSIRNCLHSKLCSAVQRLSVVHHSVGDSWFFPTLSDPIKFEAFITFRHIWCYPFTPTYRAYQVLAPNLKWYHRWRRIECFVSMVGVVEAWLAFGSPNKSRWPAPDRAESFKGSRALFAHNSRVLYNTLHLQYDVINSLCFPLSSFVHLGVSIWKAAQWSLGIVLVNHTALALCVVHIVATRRTQNWPQPSIWASHYAVVLDNYCSTSKQYSWGGISPAVDTV